MTIRDVIEKKNPKTEDDSYWYCEADYEDAFHDCEVLVWQAVGDYQGDYFALLKGPDGRYGFTVIGYGSCSGCDALQDARWYSSDREKAITDVTALLERTREGVHWEDTKEAMHKYLTSECDREMKETYISNEDEKKALWPKLLAAVS